MSKRGPYLIDVNTEDMPGKVKSVLVTFETRIQTVKQFAAGPEKYALLDDGSPEAQMLRNLLSS